MATSRTQKILAVAPTGALAAKTDARTADALRSTQSQAKKSLQAVGKSDHGNAPSEAPYRSQAERRAQGKALRDAVPRAEHSGWNPPKDRPDPVEMVLAQNAGRVLDLVPIRHGRMSQSAFAFYRGTAAIMAADLAHTPSSSLRVQACGDAHLSNFGAFATPERSVIFDLNDLDETLPAHGNGTSSA